MTLNFLGLPYNCSTTCVDTSELQVSGSYRGQRISFHSPAPQHSTSGVALRYRGVTYQP